jgi:hypothetical protein
VCPFALVTTITQMTAAPASLLAQAYHQRWKHETGNAKLKTYLRGPGRVLRPKSPDMVRQEIYGYLLTHYAISALSSKNASSRPSWPASPAPGTSTPRRRHRTYPRIVKRARHNPYRVKRPGDHGTCHPGPATISLVNLRQLTLAA